MKLLKMMSLVSMTNSLASLARAPNWRPAFKQILVIWSEKFRFLSISMPRRFTDVLGVIVVSPILKDISEFFNFVTKRSA